MNQPTPDATSGSRRRGRQRSVVYKLGMGITTALVLLAGVELCLRVVVPGNGGQRYDQITEIVRFLGTHESDMMLESDPERFWKFKPNVRIKDQANEFWMGHVSNSLGFRNPEFVLERAPGSFRVVCFGDSSTFGIGNDMPDTWPAQLEERLQASLLLAKYTRIEVINAGVPGYSSFQGLQHMRQELARLKPDLVMASYANNDFWHWDNTTDKAHAATFGRQSPGRLLMQTRIGQLLRTGLQALRSPSETDKPDGPFTDEKWAQAATRNYVVPNYDWVQRVPLDDFRQNLLDMSDFCEAHQVPLVLVKWPDQFQAAGRPSRREEYQRVISEVAAQRRLAVADVVRQFQANSAWSARTYIPNDIVHVNRDGNALAAQAALDAVLESVGAHSNQWSVSTQPTRVTSSR